MELHLDTRKLKIHIFRCPLYPASSPILPRPNVRIPPNASSPPINPAIITFMDSILHQTESTFDFAGKVFNYSPYSLPSTKYFTIVQCCRCSFILVYSRGRYLGQAGYCEKCNHCSGGCRNCEYWNLCLKSKCWSCNMRLCLWIGMSFKNMW